MAETADGAQAMLSTHSAIMAMAVVVVHIFICDRLGLLSVVVVVVGIVVTQSLRQSTSISWRVGRLYSFRMMVQ